MATIQSIRDELALLRAEARSIMYAQAGRNAETALENLETELQEQISALDRAIAADAADAAEIEAAREDYDHPLWDVWRTEAVHRRHEDNWQGV